MPVNALLRAPESPGSWVDEEACDGCGDVYRDHRDPGMPASSSARFALGADDVRHSNDPATGGGYRSRGPVLWALRVRKLTSRYEAHQYCGD